MVLTAWADGVGSNWAGFGHLYGVRQQVGLPDTYEFLCVVPFGYPKHAVKGKKNRKPLAEVASLGPYGTPYPLGSPDR
jgi:nitroreductase